jgi:hypothetical protein
MEIVGQLGEAAGEMGVGNLGQAEFGHAAIIRIRRIGIMTTSSYLSV